MKAFKYKTLISDSDLHSIHGFKYTISEIFVPKASLAFNEKGGLFSTESARGNDKEVVEIADSDVDALKQFLIDKQTCAEIIKNIIQNVKNYCDVRSIMSTFKTATAIFDFADDFSGSMLITEKRCPEKIIEIDAKDLLEFIAQSYVKPRVISDIQQASIDDLLLS